MIDKIPEKDLAKRIHGGRMYHEVLRLITDPIKEQIRTLFSEENHSPVDIVKKLGNQLGLPQEWNVNSHYRVVRELLVELLGKQKFDSISKETRSRKKTNANMDPANKAIRNQYLLNEGMTPFTNEEFEYLLHLRNQSRMARGQHRDNKKIADAMNTRFFTSRFTATSCRQKVANEQYASKKRGDSPLEPQKNKVHKNSFLIDLLRFIILNAEIEVNGINPDLLHALIQSIQKSIDSGDWQAAIDILLITQSKYTPDVQHVLEFIVGYCYLLLSNEEEANKHFRFCANLQGPLIGSINVARRAAASQLASNELRKLNDTVAVPPLVVIPSEDLCEMRTGAVSESCVEDATGGIANDVV